MGFRYHVSVAVEDVLVVRESHAVEKRIGRVAILAEMVPGLHPCWWTPVALRVQRKNPVKAVAACEGREEVNTDVTHAVPLECGIHVADCRLNVSDVPKHIIGKNEIEPVIGEICLCDVTDMNINWRKGLQCHSASPTEVGKETMVKEQMAEQALPRPVYAVGRECVKELAEVHFERRFLHVEGAYLCTTRGEEQRKRRPLTASYIQDTRGTRRFAGAFAEKSNQNLIASTACLDLLRSEATVLMPDLQCVPQSPGERNPLPRHYPALNTPRHNVGIAYHLDSPQRTTVAIGQSGYRHSRPCQPGSLLQTRPDPVPGRNRPAVQHSLPRGRLGFRVPFPGSARLCCYLERTYLDCLSPRILA